MNYLYQAYFTGQASGKNHKKFLESAALLNGKTGDYRNIERLCVISHHVDIATIQLLLTDGFVGKKNTVEIEEITDATLLDPESPHRLHIDLIGNYFLPHSKYKNISKKIFNQINS